MICPNCQHVMIEGHQCPNCAYYSSSDAELCPKCGEYKPKGRDCRSAKCFKPQHQDVMQTVPGCAGEDCEVTPPR